MKLRCFVPSSHIRGSVSDLYVFVPSSYICGSVSDLYVPTIGPPIVLAADRSWE
jgi:hypothetical protein